MQENDRGSCAFGEVFKCSVVSERRHICVLESGKDREKAKSACVRAPIRAISALCGASQGTVRDDDKKHTETHDNKLKNKYLRFKRKSYSQLWEKVGVCGRNSVLLMQLIAQTP